MINGLILQNTFSDFLRVSFVILLLCCLVGAQDYEHHQYLDDAVIYDYDPVTGLGDDVFGTIIADFSEPVDGEFRCSHGGPVCFEYANGTLVAFYANTSSHNVDGWSEYATSKDGGRTWDKYNRFTYSYNAYQKNPNRPVWVEEGFVTQNGTAVLILTTIEDGERIGNNVTRSHDNGKSWSKPLPMAAQGIGYPAAVVVTDSANFILFDSLEGHHELYISTNDGQTWQKTSTLTLQKDAWYGAMCMMEDGRLLAGAYVTEDENHLYYCISEDGGRTWSEQQKAHVDKKIRDPELAYLDGKYYLHGRSGHSGEGKHRFVLYQSNDGVQWNKGIIVSKDNKHPDGYSHNCIINKYNYDAPKQLMILYSIIYNPPRTSEYVFFVKPRQQ